MRLFLLLIRLVSTECLPVGYSCSCLRNRSEIELIRVKHGSLERTRVSQLCWLECQGMVHWRGRCPVKLVRPVWLHRKEIVLKVSSETDRELRWSWVPTFNTKSAHRRPKLAWRVGLADGNWKCFFPSRFCTAILKPVLKSNKKLGVINWVVRLYHVILRNPNQPNKVASNVSRHDTS